MANMYISHFLATFNLWWFHVWYLIPLVIILLYTDVPIFLNITKEIFFELVPVLFKSCPPLLKFLQQEILRSSSNDLVPLWGSDDTNLALIIKWTSVWIYIHICVCLCVCVCRHIDTCLHMWASLFGIYPLMYTPTYALFPLIFNSIFCTW